MKIQSCIKGNDKSFGTFPPPINGPQEEAQNFGLFACSCDLTNNLILVLLLPLLIMLFHAYLPFLSSTLCTTHVQKALFSVSLT